jgi:hypothetical protein
MGDKPTMKFSFNAKPKPKTKPGHRPPTRPPTAAPLNGIKRPRTALHDSDDKYHADGQHQEISHFDQAAGGAISRAPQREKTPLVIPAAPSRNTRLLYRAPRKQQLQKSALPTVPAADVDISLPEDQVGFGLTVRERREAGDTRPAASGPGNAARADARAPPPQPAKSEDEAALDALLGSKVDGGRTIPVLDEDESFRHDYEAAQDAPTLADYIAIPAEDFGAACLRGMGWKDTETIFGDGDKAGTTMKPRTFERRPALLGVGAKPSSALGIELGEWGRNTKGKNGKSESFNPLVLQNKKTGEKLTEQELREKVDGQKGDSKAKSSSRYV